MPKKVTVVHHSADFDGEFCREIARKFLPDAELIGWDFSDPPLMTAHPGFNQKIYVLDLPVAAPFGLDAEKLPDWVFESVIWIDHHKSSIESHPITIPGYRIDGVAACRLAWQWFTATEAHEPIMNAPTKQDFIDRNVKEPLAVRLAGEYDVWDKRDPDAELFQFGLRSRELDRGIWGLLLQKFRKPTITEIESMIDVGHPIDLRPDGTADDSVGVVRGLLRDGEMLQRYQQRNDAGMMHRSFITEFEGLKFLTLNTARCNSLTFASKDVPETGHDALMGFYFDGGKWNISLYHARHRTDLDLSLVAKKWGGGGHRGACGFQAQEMASILGSSHL